MELDVARFVLDQHLRELEDSAVENGYSNYDARLIQALRFVIDKLDREIASYRNY